MTEPAERRATWRQSIATLGRASADDGPSPLEGLNPDALAKGVAVALSSGLVDDIDWLAPTAAGVALYALAAALPVGPEQRELGRRVVARLHGGSAETFVAMATRMALGSGKGLGSAAVRARLELVCDLPFAAGIREGALALGLASGRELAREWFEAPSTGSLQGRRFTARLIERAAREAATRASNGDDHALRVFRSDAMKEAWQRLFDDRESLVWRHVAIARGLIAPFVPELESAVLAGLAPDRGPTDWRRAAASAAAMIAVRPELALRTTRSLVEGPIIERDPDVAACVVWGLARAAEAEPDATREALSVVTKRAPVEAAEALVKIRYQLVGPDAPVPEVLAAASETSRRALEAARSEDDGAVALRAELARELTGIVEGTIRHRVGAALGAYASSGARAAHVAARAILVELGASLSTLEALTQDEVDGGSSGDPLTAPGARSARRASLGVLRDIDVGVLERGTLDVLLRLGPTASAKSAGAAPQDDGRAALEDLDGLRERLGLWILAREHAPNDAHPTLRFRRLRTLVHLVDSDVGAHDEVAPRHRKRWTWIASALLASAAAGPPPAFRRTILAALARSLDALVRADLLDATDVVLLAATTFDDASDFETLEEASMDRDLVHALRRYGAFVGRKVPTPTAPDSIMPSLRAPSPDVVRLRAGLDALEVLSKDLFPISTRRGEALRTALVRLASALSAIAEAKALRHVAAGEADVVSTLETSLGAIGQLVSGARSRLDPEGISVPPPPQTRVDGPSLAVIASRAAGPGEGELSAEDVREWIESYRGVVPRSLLDLVSKTVVKLSDLPADRPSLRLEVVRVHDAGLPSWIPPRRTLGGFFVVRALGAGGAGTVFVVNRVEDRHDEAAERFALKVPDYSASAARMLSEVEFLDLFRSEASALLSLPVHPNLARFVTFDTAARPKPILVMELVEGLTLEKIIEARALDMQRALAVIDDVLKALSAMHAVEVAHLDVKPSNVVLRGGENGVLVDFGLAGRHLRPGCASGPYGAPEVWTAAPGSTASPLAADVYAFGCLAFEVLTGQPLFEAPNEMSQMAMHLAHDGFPPRLKEFSTKTGMTDLAELLFWTLRRDPASRPKVDRVREDLRKIAVKFLGRKWPLVA
jgi:hypothetical protein